MISWLLKKLLGNIPLCKHDWKMMERLETRIRRYSLDQYDMPPVEYPIGPVKVFMQCKKCGDVQTKEII